MNAALATAPVEPARVEPIIVKLPPPVGRYEAKVSGVEMGGRVISVPGAPQPS